MDDVIDAMKRVKLVVILAFGVFLLYFMIQIGVLGNAVTYLVTPSQYTQRTWILVITGSAAIVATLWNYIK